MPSDTASQGRALSGGMSGTMKPAIPASRVAAASFADRSASSVEVPHENDGRRIVDSGSRRNSAPARASPRARTRRVASRATLAASWMTAPSARDPRTARPARSRPLPPRQRHAPPRATSHGRDSRPSGRSRGRMTVGECTAERCDGVRIRHGDTSPKTPNIARSTVGRPGISPHQVPSQPFGRCHLVLPRSRLGPHGYRRVSRRSGLADDVDVLVPAARHVHDDRRVRPELLGYARKEREGVRRFDGGDDASVRHSCSKAKSASASVTAS